MEDKGKQKQERYVQIGIALLVSILEKVLEKMIEGEIPVLLFRSTMIGIMLFGAFVIIKFGGAFFKNSIAYKKKLEKLMKKAMEDEEIRRDFGYEKEWLERRYKRRRCKLIRDMMKKMVVAVVFIMALSIINPQNAHAFWDDVKALGGFETVEPIEMEEQKVKQDLPEEPKAQIERNMTWRFVLDKREELVEDYAERLQQVFFEGDTEILNTAQNWRAEEKKGVNHTTIKDTSGNTFYTYTDLENGFKAYVNSAAGYVYYDDWVKYAPHSSELDQYIKGREELNKVEMSGEIGCYEIWWKLANDYQYYALEYERQTKDAEAILYYYANSIYCCMESLKYIIDDETYDDTYHYMVTRYKDIFRYECLIDENYKEQAEAIYSILVTEDVLSKENM